MLLLTLAGAAILFWGVRFSRVMVIAHTIRGEASGLADAHVFICMIYM
jgi:hypothetical protein